MSAGHGARGSSFGEAEEAADDFEHDLIRAAVDAVHAGVGVGARSRATPGGSSACRSCWSPKPGPKPPRRMSTRTMASRRPNASRCSAPREPRGPGADRRRREQPRDRARARPLRANDQDPRHAHPAQAPRHHTGRRRGPLPADPRGPPMRALSERDVLATADRLAETADRALGLPSPGRLGQPGAAADHVRAIADALSGHDPDTAARARATRPCCEVPPPLAMGSVAHAAGGTLPMARSGRAGSRSG